MGFVVKTQIGANQHSVGTSLYGTCSTAANTAAKVVTLPDFDALITGTTIHVKFTYSNTAANPTLNVNGTGALAIYRHGVTTPGTSKVSTWAAGAVISFTFDGSYWMMEEPFDLTQLVNLIYPVGSIYMSVNSTSPATLFGGTWQRIQDKFLVSAGSTYTSTGGAATVTLSTSNLPSHKHSVGAHKHGLNSHVHSVGAHAHGLNSHTHTGPSHTHGLNSHTHSIPALSGTAASNGAHTHKSAETGKWFTILKYITGRSGTQKINVSFDSGSNKTFGTSGDWDDIGMQESTGSAGAHTHTVSTSSSTTGAASGSTAAAGTGNTGGPSTANTANSTAFNSGAASGDTANSTAFDSGATGSGTAFSIIPPYQAVYVWKRTA